jgi:hypothetical protein
MENPAEMPTERGFALRAYGLYSELVAQRAPAGSGQEPSLGGKLLYVGELDEVGRALVVASNVAGAASLSASADGGMQRSVIQEGIVDCVVNSLDEALRILKNEIRKKEAVSVCVALPAELIETEMGARGVLPDVRRGGVWVNAGYAAMKHAGSDNGDPASMSVLVLWNVDTAPAQWLPRLDAMAMEALGANAAWQRRWLRLAPRYLGRIARGVRLIRSNHEFAASFVERVRAALDSGELAVPVRIEVTSGEMCDEHRFAPKLAGS